MIKKIIINILLIASILNLSAFFCFAQEAEADDYKLLTLYNLGIITKNVDPEAFVTRGEFIDTAVKLRNAYGADFADISFEDVSPDYEYYNSVETAARYGLIKGDGKQVNAGSIITAGQVQTILLRVLGYVNLDQENTDAVAKSINKKYIKPGTNEMTWAAVINAVYDALEVETVRSSPSANDINYVTTGKLLLEDYHNIYTDEGVVEGVGESLLTGKATTGSGIATINGGQYRCDDLKIRELLGRRVKFYYTYDENEIVYAREYGNNVTVLNGEDIESYKDGKIGYEYNDKVKYAKISNNADFLYNDRFAEAVKEKDLISPNAAVTLIDNNSDELFDVIIVSKYDICIVDSIGNGDKKNEYIILKYPVNNKQKIKPDEITDENLSGTDIREIMQNDVLCVYESMNGDYVRAVVCSNEVSGSAESIYTEDEKKYAVINGEIYRFSDECIKNQANLIDNKTDAAFILDVNKKIAYINKFSDSLRFGYVIDVRYDKFEENIYFKILTEDNSVITAKASDNVTFNGSVFKDKNIFWESIGGKNYRQKLIQYRLNSNGEIKFVNDGDTADKSCFFEKYYSDYEQKNGIMQKKSDNEKHYFKSNSLIIANRVNVDSDTVIMIVPNDPSMTDEKYYLCTDISYLIDDIEYRVEAYRSVEDEFTADVILIYDDISSDYSISDQNIGISVLDGVIIALNSDNEVVDGLKLWDNGVQCSYPLKDNIILKSVYGERTPTRGDIIRYSLRDGAINKLELIYSAADDTMVASTSVTHKNDNNKYTQFRVWDAYVFFRWGSNLMLSDTMPTDYNNFNVGDYYTHSCSTSSIIVCKKSGNSDIYTGTMDNLIGYKNTSGAECSRIVLYERYGEGRTIVIYE